MTAELAAVLGWDTITTRIPQARRRALSVDAASLTDMVIVEYDGSYWHRDKAAKDAAKTAKLVAAGFTVIRVREAPLTALTPADVIVTSTEPIHRVAARVVRQLVELRPDVVTLDQVTAYEAVDGPTAGDAAASAILERTEPKAVQLAA